MRSEGFPIVGGLGVGPVFASRASELSREFRAYGKSCKRRPPLESLVVLWHRRVYGGSCITRRPMPSGAGWVLAGCCWVVLGCGVRALQSTLCPDVGAGRVRCMPRPIPSGAGWVLAGFWPGAAGCCLVLLAFGFVASILFFD